MAASSPRTQGGFRCLPGRAGSQPLPSIPATIQVSLKILADLPQVYADPLHVEQVLGNLITNACQAMTSPSLD
jgi:signal transduction histidine kinase